MISMNTSSKPKPTWDKNPFKALKLMTSEKKIKKKNKEQKIPKC
jgi:hypothetical protein